MCRGRDVSLIYLKTRRFVFSIWRFQRFVAILSAWLLTIYGVLMSTKMGLKWAKENSLLRFNRNYNLRCKIQRKICTIVKVPFKWRKVSKVVISKNIEG